MIERAARALLSLGCFVGIGSILMVLGTPEGSAARIVSIIALLFGVGITVASAVVLRLGIRRRDQIVATPTPIDDNVVQPKEEK